MNQTGCGSREEVYTKYANPRAQRQRGPCVFGFYPEDHAAYLSRSLSRYFLLCAVTSHACGQKHRSTHHQSCGTPAFKSAGASLSKSSLPVPNGLCVEVLCSFRLPSLSITWT